LLTLAGHSSAIDCLVFSPSGNRLATASRDETAKLWDVETGRELLTLKGHTDIVSSIAFSPDGKRLVTGGRDGKVKIWDSQTGRILMTLKSPGGFPSSVAFSPDGTHLAARGNDAITLWNALPWRDDDLPGDADMACNERIRLRNIGQSKETSPR
jgi:WD40 repeat protein